MPTERQDRSTPSARRTSDKGKAVTQDKKQNKVRNPRTMKKIISIRSIVVLAVCIFAWGLIIGRLFTLQVNDYAKYRVQAANNIRSTTSLTSGRGLIYDRNMTQLATNMTTYRVFISPKAVYRTEQEGKYGTLSYSGRDVQQLKRRIAEGLSDMLDVTYDEVYALYDRVDRQDVTVQKNIADADLIARVQDYIYYDYGETDENGNHIERTLKSYVFVGSSPKRYYPYGSLASHVIGYASSSSGLIGLELQYDAEMTGVDGRYVTARDGIRRRMPFKYDVYVEARNGYSLVTTLDINIQAMLEEQLKKTYEESMPLNRVTGIVMGVDSGEILAMGTYPDFNLNDPFTLNPEAQGKLDEYRAGWDEGGEEYIDENGEIAYTPIVHIYPTEEEIKSRYNDLLYGMWKNKSVSELHEPGSTTKIITTAMALEEGLVTFDEMFECEGLLHIEGYNKAIHCHRLAGHGVANFATMLQQSCNPTLMTIASRIGRTKFYEYFRAFGYTEKTGIDLPGEAAPIYHAFSGFNQVELAVYSFGQTFKVTPLQQLTAICAIANGGYLVTPHVVSALIDDNGNIVQSFEGGMKRQVVSTEVCESITNVLEEGVSGNGGAKNAYVAGYKIAAKTGTSEVRDILDENGNSYLRIGSCGAYAPADDPQVAVIIVVDQPQCESIYGSIVAAPYVANLMNDILPTLGVDRQYSEEEQSMLKINVANYVGWPLEDAKASIKIKGIKCSVVGDVATDGSAVVNYQMPPAGNSIQKDTGKIILYTGEATADNMMEVPDLKGYTAKVANRILVTSGFNVNIVGATNYDIGTGAVVTAQSPAGGEKVAYGSVIELTLRYLDGTAN